MAEELVMLLIRGAFALGTAKVEWDKIEPRVKGKKPEEIPAILDELFAEGSAKFDKTIDNMPEDPT